MSAERFCKVWADVGIIVTNRVLAHVSVAVESAVDMQIECQPMFADVAWADYVVTWYTCELMIFITEMG